MKYKKGGSPIQPNTNNPTLSTNPTLSKSKYSSFKSFLNDIKIFVKSNFIQVMLVSLVLIFYIFLWFRDPLTQEDIQVEIAKVTCGNGWSQDKCPPNKFLASGVECINNQCDENTCCVNQINCSEWDGTCPNNFDIDNTKSCSPDIENECSDNCCVKTCANFLNADCRDFTKVATNFCSIPEGSNEYSCSYDDCCVENITCATDFNPEDCRSNQKFISSPASVICDNNNCTALDCCEPDSESDTNPPTTQPTIPPTTPTTTPPTTTPTTPPTTPLTSPSSNVDSVSEEQIDIGETDDGE